MKLPLDKATRDRLKTKKKAERAFRKLGSRGLSAQRRFSLKQVLARGLREFPTGAEAKIKPFLLVMGFAHSEVVCGYIPDFAHHGKRLIVEIDGPVHETRKAEDREKDINLAAHGWRVLRFTNRQVADSLDAVLREVREYIV